MTGKAAIAAVVAARMSSRRLPGKVIKPLMGRPMLAWLLDRLEHCHALDGLCVATSEQASDDPIATFCMSRGVVCYRGELDNVAARILGAATTLKADAVVRISGDSPFMDGSLVASLVELYRRESPDLASNVVVRSFPKGQSVEVLNVESLRRELPRFDGKDDNEHVTPYFYRNAGRLRIAALQQDANHSAIQLSVDSKEDFDRAARLIGRFTRPHWTYRASELVDMLAEEAE